MKKKLSSKVEPKNAPAPPPAAWLVMHGGNIKVKPYTIRSIKFYPRPPRLPTSIELAARKIFPEVEADAPEWAKRASQMAFTSAMPPTRKRKASEKYLEGFDCGKFSAAEEMLPPDVRLTSPAEYGGKTDVQLAADLPSNQRADFFCGFRDGEKSIQEMPNRAKVIQTIKAYQTIAADWREASKCEGNAGQLHQWLIDKGAINFKTDPAATRKICRIIGFPTRSKPGRPQEEK
jgi:hypothetical protein